EILTRPWRNNIPTLLFGALGLFWVPTIYMLVRLGKREQRFLCGAFVVALCPALLTVDTTRVLALLAFPVALAGVIWWSESVERESTLRLLPWFLLAVVFVPRVHLWSLPPYISTWDRLLNF